MGINKVVLSDAHRLLGARHCGSIEQSPLHRRRFRERLDDVQLTRASLEQGSQPTGVENGLAAKTVVKEEQRLLGATAVGQGVHPLVQRLVGKAEVVTLLVA